MVPNKIKSLLIEKDIKQATIAAELGVTRGAVSGVINGHSVSKRIRKCIAKYLCLQYREVWPKSLRPLRSLSKQL